MKKGLALCLITAFFLSINVENAEARARITFGENERLEKVHDLPQKDEYKAGGKHIDLGILYKTFDITVLPIWVLEEPKIVGYGDADTYYDLTDEETETILKANNLERDSLTKLSFSTKYIGKIIILVIIALVIYGMIPSKKDKPTPKKV